MSEFQNSRRLAPEDADVFVLSKLLNRAFGTTEQLLTRPGGMKVLVMNIIANGFNIIPGDYRARTFVDGDVTVGTDVIVVDSIGGAHEFQAGDGPYQLTTTVTLPAGLALLTNYYVEVVDADEIALHLTQLEAVRGDPSTRVDITAAASGGTHTIAGVPINAGGAVTDGYDSILYSTPSSPNFSTRVARITAPDRITVVGDNAASELQYWWY